MLINYQLLTIHCLSLLMILLTHGPCAPCRRQERFGAFQKVLEPGHTDAIRFAGFDLCGTCISLRKISTQLEVFRSSGEVKISDCWFQMVSEATNIIYYIVNCNIWGLQWFDQQECRVDPTRKKWDLTNTDSTHMRIETNMNMTGELTNKQGDLSNTNGEFKTCTCWLNQDKWCFNLHK